MNVDDLEQERETKREIMCVCVCIVCACVCAVCVYVCAVNAGSARVVCYGVATVSRLLKIIGLFCKRAL